MKALQPIEQDEVFQTHILELVSRTFALTIPQLPEPLDRTVSNAYLLCRIADTIEDDPSLSFKNKQYYCKWFASLVKDYTCADNFATELASKLGDTITNAEKELIEKCDSVLKITHSLTESERSAMLECLEAMTTGMVKYQGMETLKGLKSQEDLDLYCYYVAGVVGVMLTKLFLEYGKEWSEKTKQGMKTLAISFGQGLQMTNIIKDFWVDRKRGACWLPQSVFKPLGISLENTNLENVENFEKGIEQIIFVARNHLVNAFYYTILIPKKEKGIRMFCLWAILMATLTLSKVKNSSDFFNGQSVKISRTTVSLVVLFSNLCNRSNLLLKTMFKLTTLKI